jgi:hypothetical protein
MTLSGWRTITGIGDLMVVEGTSKCCALIDLGLRRLVKAENEVGWVETALIMSKVILKEIESDLL